MRLRARAKGQLRRLPLDEWAEPSLEGWLARFWILPSERWAEAVDLRLEERELRRRAGDGFGWLAQEPDETRQHNDAAAWKDYEARHRRLWDAAQPPSLLTSPQAVRAFRDFESLQREFDADSARDRRARERIGQVAQRLGPPDSPPPLGAPWDAWVVALPEEDRAAGRLACLLWRDMIDLRNRLAEAIRERRTLAALHEADARRVLDVRMLDLRSRLRTCDEAYRRFAEPFFARHGTPPLPGSEAK